MFLYVSLMEYIKIRNGSPIIETRIRLRQNNKFFSPGNCLLFVLLVTNCLLRIFTILLSGEAWKYVINTSNKKDVDINKHILLFW